MTEDEAVADAKQVALVMLLEKNGGTLSVTKAEWDNYVRQFPNSGIKIDGDEHGFIVRSVRDMDKDMSNWLMPNAPGN